MGYLLDSDIIIDFLKNKGSAVSLLQQIQSQQWFISIISWLEILYGVEKSTQPKKRREEFKKFLSLSQTNILPLEEKIGQEFIRLKVNLEKKGQRLADFDLLIAATALVHQLTLVTGNQKHFKRINRLKAIRRNHKTFYNLYNNKKT